MPIRMILEISQGCQNKHGHHVPKIRLHLVQCTAVNSPVVLNLSPRFWWKTPIRLMYVRNGFTRHRPTSRDLLLNSMEDGASGSGMMRRSTLIVSR